MVRHRQHADNLIAVLVFAGLSAWGAVLTLRSNVPWPEGWRSGAGLAGALLAGLVTRRVFPALRVGRLAVLAFVAHCLLLGLLARLDFVAAGFQLAIAIGIAQLGAVIGAVIPRALTPARAPWLVVALAAVQFAVFVFSFLLIKQSHLPAILLFLGVFGGALLFVALVSDLETWHIAVATSANVITAVLTIRPTPPDASTIEPIAMCIAFGVLGGLVGRNLRKRRRPPPTELPPAQMRD